MLYPADKIRKLAEDYYRSGDFLCSEVMIRVFLDSFKLDYDKSVIALASGFPGGMGGSGCSCGAVVGGVMVLGMFFGRTEPKDKSVFTCLDLSKELHDAFKARHKAICCRVLNHGLKIGSDEQKNSCTIKTGDAAEMTLQIIEKQIIKRKWQDRFECLL